MDRTAWIVVALCVVGLVLWEFYLAKQMGPRPAPVSVAPGRPSPAATPAILAPSPSPTPVAEAAPSSTPTPSFAEKIETLRNSDVELRLTNRGGGIKEAVLLKQIAEKGQRVVLNSDQSAPIGAILEQPSTPVLPEFTASAQPDSVQFEHTTAEQVAIRKKFFFEKSPENKDNYVIEMDVDLENRGNKPYQSGGYFVALGSAASIHPRDYPYYTKLLWYIAGKGLNGKDVGWFAASPGFFGLNPRAARPFYQENIAGAEWVAVTNQFFTTLMVPLTAKATGVWGRRFDIDHGQDQKLTAIEGAFGMPGFQLQPGQTYDARFEIYAGPKIYNRLAQLSHNEAEVMDFSSFTILKVICQFLLNFLNLLHHWLGNYGVAILALTTVIKLTLWPLQNQANRSMRKMAALSPKVQELRDKYKDDPTRMNQEMMKLYKQYGINPVGGCLPMVIQIPIFFGLFTMLGRAVELRNATFLWVKDLSQPDILFVIPGLGWIPFFGIPSTGLPINILPILMGATQIWLMAMTPKTGDPTQRRVMMFTPLIFLFICYNFAAALALYYTAQNLFSILQFYQNKRQPAPTLEKVAPAGKRKR
jgi:YidC/Oxa1 family membrane protein insertase